MLARLRGLDEVLANAGPNTALVVVDVVLARQSLELGPVPNLSPYGRAIEILVRDAADDDAVARALRLLPAQQQVDLLYIADKFVTPRLAPRIAEAAVTHGVTMMPRVAALLAVHAPDRLPALLAGLRDAALLEAVTEAYLALVDLDAPIPPALEAAWSTLTSPPQLRARHFEAQLRLAARRDPLEALTAAEEAITEVGADQIPHGVVAVMVRAVRADRARAWAAFAAEHPCESRARILDALVQGEPAAPELEAAFADVIAQANDRNGWGYDPSPRGAFGMVMPLLGGAATAGRLDLAATSRDTFGPSRGMIKLATYVETRRRFLRSNTWEPGEWEALAPPDYREGAAARMFLPIPDLTSDQLAAWWKLSTLPLPSMCWPSQQAAGLP